MPKDKAKIAEMPQSSVVQDDVIIVDLLDDEEAIWTGAMNGCCSVIFLWNLDPVTGRYGRVRGQHGAGGPRALDWAKLAKDVPKDAKMIMACNKAQFGRGNDGQDYVQMVKDMMTDLKITVRERTFSDEEPILVDRKGAITQLGNPDFAKYMVRTPTAERKPRR